MRTQLPRLPVIVIVLSTLMGRLLRYCRSTF